MKSKKAILLFWLVVCPAVFAGRQDVVPIGVSPETMENNACISCHINQVGRLSEIVEEWKQSEHFNNNVTCDGCHGGDPTVKQEQFDTDEEFTQRSHLRRDNDFFILIQTGGFFTSSARGRSVSYFCGKCHANIKEKHLGSPHGDLGSPTCLYCHGQGSHAIKKTDVDIIDPRPKSEDGQCATCHRAATMETVATVKEILESTQVQLVIATEQYSWLQEQGYKNLALEKMFLHSQETLSQLRQTFHSFNMREINNFANAIKDNAELSQQTFDMINALEQSKITQSTIATGSVFFLLSFAGLLLYYRKKYLHL